VFIRQIEDESLAQYAYLLGCEQTGDALLVDPERDVDRYLDFAAHHGFRVAAVTETHIHADFLSGTRELAARTPGLNVYLSDGGDLDWKYSWPARDGVRAVLLRDGHTFQIGRLEIRAWHTPGHTPEHLTYVVTDRGGGATAPLGILSGDFVFAGDLGRPDLLESAAGIAGMMEPSAKRLFASTRKFLELPDYLQVWPGHGAGSACGKALGAIPVTTVGYERRASPAIAAIHDGEQAFVRFILSDQPDPPLYFARMKALNRDGPPLLGSLPVPARLSLNDLHALLQQRDVQIVDTVRDRRTFFAGHVPRAFYAPDDKTFPTVIGSLLDPNEAIVLLIDETRLDPAVRQLVRIGYDRIEGWAPRPSVQDLRTVGVIPATIESVDFEELERRRGREGVTVLDVRTSAEHAVDHIPGALNIPHTRLRGHLSAIPNDRPVFVHCALGGRAAVSAALLDREGISVVHVEGRSGKVPHPAR
jgi:hydroxyacylglutathione hydrolase